jgi:hypothetical protein
MEFHFNVSAGVKEVFGGFGGYPFPFKVEFLFRTKFGFRSCFKLATSLPNYAQWYWWWRLLSGTI